MQQEEKIVERAKRGEAQAFEQLYETYFNRIYRYIMNRVSSQADAEDLTQQVFLKALESIGSFKWRGVSFSSWLFRIAHNQVVDHDRKGSREKTLPLDEERLVSSADPAIHIEKKLTGEQLFVSCKQLSDAQQEVISLRFAAGLSITKTSEAMGRSEGAVKVLQHDAIVRLRRILSSNEEEING